MTSIWLPSACSLKKYKATVNGAKAVVDISIEVNDHSDLGYLLRELEEILAEQKKALHAAKRATAKAAAAKATAPKLLEKPLLQLEHHQENKS